MTEVEDWNIEQTVHEQSISLFLRFSTIKWKHESSHLQL